MVARMKFTALKITTFDCFDRGEALPKVFRPLSLSGISGGACRAPTAEIVHREKPFEAATTGQERRDRARGEKSVAIQRVTC
jgi:hypothetical protein